MSLLTRYSGSILSIMLASILFAGCGDTAQPEKAASGDSKKPASKREVAADQDSLVARSDDDPDASSAKTSVPAASFAPVKLGSGTASSSGEVPKSTRSPENSHDDVKKALKPLQVLIGQWHGSAQKLAGGTKGYEEFNWIWDVRTDKAQPALTMKSDDSPYVKSARLTYLLDEQQYQLTVIDKEEHRRELRGTFSEEPSDKPGEDKKQTPQRTYKLLLTETGDAKGRWQILMNQQENNRYLLELSRAQGSRFSRFDTVGNQREGTSFALSDSEYKDRTCVISQGLGTIQVSHKGKSYWVCCTGCKAAFEEDPEKWITKFEAMSK